MLKDSYTLIFILIGLASLTLWVPAQATQAQTKQPGGATPATQTPTPQETTPLTATATSMPSPTATVTTTPSPTASPQDAHEPNDEPDQAATLHLNRPLADLTLDPAGDRDYFRLYLKPAQVVRAATFPQAAADTRLIVYSPAGAVLGQNDDRSQTDLGSTVAWASRTEGWYLLLVESSTPFGGTYRLMAALEMPTATPTPSPTPEPEPTATPPPTTTPLPSPTPYTQTDPGEPNNRPQDAFPVLPGTPYPMTLGPVGTDTHDFFTLLGKAGITYRCAAQEPQGVDPALRVYAGAIGEGVLVAENDDVAPADIGSRVTFTAAADAPLFIVVEARAGYGDYTFSCQGGAVAGGNRSAGSNRQAAPTPTANPAALRIDIYIDWNGDEVMTVGEGADGMKVLVTSLDGAWALARRSRQGEVLINTDELAGAEQVLVSVPYLHHSQVVDLTDTAHVPVMVPAPTLPVMLP